MTKYAQTLNFSSVLVLIAATHHLPKTYENQGLLCVCIPLDGLMCHSLGK